MTVEISPDQIPDTHLNILIQSATKIIRSTPENYAYVRVPVSNGSYILWIGLNDKGTLEECYFFSNDFVKPPISNRPSNGLKF